MFTSYIVLNIVLPVLGTIVTALAGKAVQTLNKEYDLTIEESAVKTGVAAAEKWAENIFKQTGAKIPSSEKLDKAMAYVNMVVPNAMQVALQQKLLAMVEAEVLKLTNQSK